MASAPHCGQNRTLTALAPLKLLVATQNCALHVTHLRHFGSRTRILLVRNMPASSHQPHPMQRADRQRHQPRPHAHEPGDLAKLADVRSQQDQTGQGIEDTQDQK